VLAERYVADQTGGMVNGVKLQLRERPRQRSPRPGQLRVQQSHQSRQQLRAGTGIITRQSRTLLPPRTAYSAVPHHRSAPHAEPGRCQPLPVLQAFPVPDKPKVNDVRVPFQENVNRQQPGEGTTTSEG